MRAMTYSDESVLIATLALHVVLLRDLIALVQASAAGKTGRRYVVVIVIFVVLLSVAVHGWLRGGA